MRCNKVQLADILGMSVRTLDARLKEGVIPFLKQPGGEDGGKDWLFDTVVVIQSIVNREGTGEKADEVKEAKGRQTIAEAGLKELDLSERMAQVFWIEDARPYWQEMFTVFKTRYNAIPSRLSQILAVETDPAAIFRLLKSELNAALEGIQADKLAEQIRDGLTKRP